MKLKFFIFLFLIFSVQELYSQKLLYLGINGGITFSNIKEHDNLGSVNFDYNSGFTSGFNLEMLLKSHLCVAATLSYYQNGYDRNDQEVLSLPGTTITKSYFQYNDLVTQHYLNNSWLIGCHFGNKLSISIYTGLYWAVFLGADCKSITGIYIDPDEVDAINDPAFKKGYHEYTSKDKMSNHIYTDFDFGISSMIKMGYNLNEKFQVTMSAGNKSGLINISPNYLIDKAYNRSFDLSLGLYMKLN